MTDPWKNIRNRPAEMLDTARFDGLTQRDLDTLAQEWTQLLADAYALLTIKLVCDEVMDRAPLEDAEGVPDWLDTLLGKLSLTMSALPKHLRRSE